MTTQLSSIKMSMVTEKRTYVNNLKFPIIQCFCCQYPLIKYLGFSAFDEIFLLISIGLGPGWQKVIDFFLVSRSHLIFGEVSCNKIYRVLFTEHSVYTLKPNLQQQVLFFRNRLPFLSIFVNKKVLREVYLEKRPSSANSALVRPLK